MKKYTETKGERLFDWNKFLENPPKKGSEEHLGTCNLSEDWVTCACGTQCEIIPRDVVGMPLDDKLRRLGLQFYTEIQLADWESAKDYLELIENRSSELISQLTK
jgi:hypothetical protein